MWPQLHRDAAAALAGGASWERERGAEQVDPFAEVQLSLEGPQPAAVPAGRLGRFRLTPAPPSQLWYTELIRSFQVCPMFESCWLQQKL